jgi:Zinc knuckle
MSKSKDKEAVEMLTATYYPQTDTSNIEKVLENWKIALRAMYGPITSFITTDEYPVAKPPEEPLFTDAVEGSLKYEAIKKEYFEGISEAVKENRRMLNERTKIAGTMLAHMSPECLAHCARDEAWKPLVEAADDPLEILRSMSKSLRSKTVGDTLRAKKGVCQAYSRHYQKEGQTLAAYLKEREHLIQSMKAMGVPDKDEEELAMDFIDGLDRRRYSTLQIHVQNERERMPRTLATAYDKAAGWIVTVTKRAESYVSEQINKQKGKKKEKKGGKKDPSKIVCYVCGKTGHIASVCPDRKKVESDDDDDDEKANVAASDLVASDSEDEEEESFICYKSKSAKDKLKVVLEKAYKVGSGGQLHANAIGLDSMCSAHLFGNRRLVSNIRACEPIRFKGIGGIETVKEVGDHPSFGRIYLRPKTATSSKVNLLSLGVLQTVKGFKIEYRQKSGSFLVRGLDKVSYEFELGGGKLFVCDMSDTLDDTALWSEACYHVETEDDVEPDPVPNPVLVETVAKNEGLYTKKEVAAARRVKEFSAAMGHLSQGMLHNIVTTRRVQGIDFNHDDINRAQAIYGQDLQAVRGKSVRHRIKKADPVVGKVVSPNCVLHTDIMFVCGLPFLISILKPIYLTLVTLIKSRNVFDVKRAVDKQIASVQSEGFKVEEVSADGEGAIGAMATELEASGCKVSIHGKSTDSADIDVKIRQVKNVLRSILVLPFLVIMAIIPHAVYFAVSKVNMLPSRANAHNYSPMEMFLGRSISFKRDLGGLNGQVLAFGSRVEIYDRTSNTIADRTSPALFLGSKATHSAAHGSISWTLRPSSHRTNGSLYQWTSELSTESTRLLRWVLLCLRRYLCTIMDLRSETTLVATS